MRGKKMTISIRNNVATLLLTAACATWMIPYHVQGFQMGTQTQQPVLKEPPMAFKWPIVGTLPDFFARGGVDGLSEVYQSMYSDFGPIFGMSILGDDELIVCDPIVFDTVLRKEGRYPIGGAEAVTTFTDYYKENNLTQAMMSTTHGADWKEWRRSLDPDMYTLWKTYLPTIGDTCQKISKVAGYEVTEKKNIDFVDFISRAAFDMFTAVMYGESPQTTNSAFALSEDIEFVQASQTAFDITGVLMTNPLEKVFGGDLYQSFVVNMDKTFDFANKKTKEYAERATRYQIQQKQMVEEQAQRDHECGIIEDSFSLAGEAVESNGKTSKCPVNEIKNSIQTNFLNPSFVERLVNRGELTNDEISELGAPLLMAGVDTTAYVMSWLYLNLASNPHIQTKLAQELKEVLNGADVTTVEEMDSLPYLKACIRESHRLTPAAPIVAKKLEQDIDIMVDGETYKVQAGHRISLNLRAFPMDEKYVDNPTQYRPERFLPDAIKARKGTRSQIIDHPSFEDPFGRGKRRCLGGNIAKAEILILAARMIQDWEITLVQPNAEWKPKQKLMLKADPYPAMKLVARKYG